jgi:hypothetical protein
MNRGLISLFPRQQSVGERLKANALEAIAEVWRFERTHARVAWAVTVAGFAIGLLLRSL